MNGYTFRVPVMIEVHVKAPTPEDARADLREMSGEPLDALLIHGGVRITGIVSVNTDDAEITSQS